MNARLPPFPLYISKGVSLGTSGLGGIIAGILADRVGKRDILAITILTYSMGSLITALAPTYGVFLFGKYGGIEGKGKEERRRVLVIAHFLTSRLPGEKAGKMCKPHFSSPPFLPLPVR
jgi:MFS family permease